MGIPNFVVKLLILFVLIYIAYILYKMSKDHNKVVKALLNGNSNQAQPTIKEEVKGIIQQSQGYLQSASETMASIFGGNGAKVGLG